MKKKRCRKQKVHLIFNEEERKDFLLGFRKRREARKLKVKEELENRKKDEKKKIKLEQKDELRKMLLSQRTVPEVEHLVEPTTYDLPEHMVTIAEVNIEDQLQFINEDIAKNNQVDPEEFQELNDPEIDDENSGGPKVDIIKKFKKQWVKAHKTNAAFSASKVLQKKKDKKKSKQQKLILKRESKKIKKNKKCKKKKKKK